MTSALRKMTKQSIMDNCTRNKLYRTPHLNDVLYLHFQGFNEIENLEEYTEVKCLWLENNAFTKIQGLDNQKRLKCLFLQNNLINKLQNLDNCKELDTLNLCHNQIRVIENIGSDVLPVLNTLSISHNFLRTAEQLEGLRNCKFLSVLDISHNRIDDVTVVKILADMPELRVLTMTGNPVISQIPSYRKTMILECRELTYLDSRPVFPRDRACAEAWKQGGFQAEQKEHRRWGRMDRKRTRDSVNALLAMRKDENGEPVQLLKSSSDEEDDEVAPECKPVDYGDKDNIEKNTLQGWRAIERQVLEGALGPAEPTRENVNIDEPTDSQTVNLNNNQRENNGITLQGIRGMMNNNRTETVALSEENQITSPSLPAQLPATETFKKNEKLEVTNKSKASVRFVSDSEEDDNENEQQGQTESCRRMITWGKKLIEEIEASKVEEKVVVMEQQTTTQTDSKPSVSTSTADLQQSSSPTSSFTRFPLSIERSHDSIDFPVGNSSEYDPNSYYEQREIGIVEAKNRKNLENSLQIQCFASQTTDSLLDEIENENEVEIGCQNLIYNKTKIEELLPNESNSSESSSECDSVREYPLNTEETFKGVETVDVEPIMRQKSSSAEDSSSSSSSTPTEDFFPQVIDTELLNTMNEITFDSDNEGDGDDEANKSEEEEEEIDQGSQLVRGMNITNRQYNATMRKYILEREAEDALKQQSQCTTLAMIEAQPSTSSTLLTQPNDLDTESIAPDQASDTKSEVWQIDVANNYEIKRFEKKKKGTVSFLLPQGEDEDTVERCRNRLFLIQKLLEWGPTPGLDERSLTVNGEVVVEDIFALREQRMRESNERLHQLIDRIYARRDEINARFDEITSFWGNFKNPHKLTHATEALAEIKTTNELLKDATNFSNSGVGGKDELPTQSDIDQLKQKFESGELKIKGFTVDDLNEINVKEDCKEDDTNKATTSDQVVQECPLKIETWANLYLETPIPNDLKSVQVDLRNEDSKVIRAIVSLIIESCVEFNMMHAFQFFNFDTHLTGIVRKYRQRLQEFLSRYNDRKFADDCLQEWRPDRGSAEEFLDLFGDNDGVVDKIKQLIMREYSIDFDNDEEKSNHLNNIILTCKQVYKSHIDNGPVFANEVESNDSDDNSDVSDIDEEE